jgi:ATP-dependent RNA helicase SUPV3L1/SUV3
MCIRDRLGGDARRIVAERLERWLADWQGERLGPLMALARASAAADLGGPARGIAYQLVEGLGSAARAAAAPLIAQLDATARARLTALGVRFGCDWLYVPQLLRPAAIEARALLLRLRHGQALATPPAGRTVLRGEGLPEDAALLPALGFAGYGRFALRQDLAERLAAGVRERARAAARFPLPVELAAAAGLTREELAALLTTLGFEPQEEQGTLTYAASERRRRRVSRRQPGAGWSHGPSPFAVLASLKVAR